MVKRLRIILSAALLLTANWAWADPQALYESAMLEREEGDLERSIALFEQVLAEDPSLHRARLELAVARFLALDFQGARNQAGKVSEAADTPDSVRQRINAFLLRVQEASKPHSFEASIGIGLVYDTNANAGPDETSFDLGGGFTLVLSETADPKESWAAEVDAWFSHRYLFPRTYRIAGRNAALAWVTRISADLRKYFDFDDQNLDILALQTGPLAIAARRWRGTIKLVAHHLRRGEDPYANFIGVNPVLIINTARKGSHIRLSGLAQRRRYKKNSDKILDGHLLSFSAAFRQMLRNDKYSVTPTVSIFREDTKHGAFANRGVLIGVTGEARLRPTDLVFVHVSHRWADFDDEHPIFSMVREDRTWRAVIGWERELGGAKLKGFTLVTSLSYSKRRSNIDLYDYSRVQAAVNLKRNFK